MIYVKKQSKLAQVLTVSACCSLSSCGLISFGSSPDSEKPVEPPVIDQIENPEGNKLRNAPPVGEVLKGRPGFLISPYTGNIVDVTGLASGLLVRDPQDPDEAHTFYIP